METNAEACSKGASGEQLKNCLQSSYNTLSGFEAADGRNSWETFKVLLSEEVNHKSCTSDKQISSEASDTVNLMVSVEDTGVGIPLHAQNRVFMPFMQADSSTSRTYGGTGIGLSISRCLVELMSGEMGFVSRPGIGSTFTFTAVFRKCHANSLEDTKRPQSEALPTGFRGLKAVVVDGRPVRAEVTKYHLQRLGVQVEIANDIKSSLALVSGGQNGDIRNGATGNKDMILVDKESWGPGTGLNFPQQLRDARQNQKISIDLLPKMILLATSINTAESEKAKAVGFVETVIMKPLRASMVAACLQQVLGLGNKRQQGRGLMDGPPFLQSLLFGKHILVVDDNRVNRRVAAGALKKYGANVECAESGKAAIAMLQLPHTFDACFMDVQMPEMDGFEATRQIRNIECTVNAQIEAGVASKEAYGNVSKWHVPILAMTADVIQATPEECSRCGMDGYVSKPFEEEQLYRAVAQFFESIPTLTS